MTVLCANCHTANRDRAMFCIGCAGKLPAFAATGPSALETVGAKPRLRQTVKGAAPMAARRAPTSAHVPRGLVMALLLLGATVLALAAWISFGPERAAAPGMASAAAPPSSSPATAAPVPAPVQLQALPVTPVGAPAAVAGTPRPAQVPVESALSPGESTVPAMAPPAAPPVVASAAPAARPPVIATSPARTSTATRSAGDPRSGCEHLFFVLAARCEAEHCNQAAYSRHPRCDVVRDQRRRDEARRNPTGGF